MVQEGITVNKKGQRVENKIVGKLPQDIWQKTINEAKKNAQYKSKDGTLKDGFIRLDYGTGELYTIKSFGLDPTIRAERKREKERLRKERESIKEKKKIQKEALKEKKRKEKQSLISKKLEETKKRREIQIKKLEEKLNQAKLNL